MTHSSLARLRTDLKIKSNTSGGGLRKWLVFFAVQAAVLPPMSFVGAASVLFLRTPLEGLTLTAFRGSEAISAPFLFELDMVADVDPSIREHLPPSDIVGKDVTFGVQGSDGREPRFFHGYVGRFSVGDEDENGRRRYRAQVVPWLWFLKRASDCRIFRDMSVREIVLEVFNDLRGAGIAAMVDETRLSREYPTRECTVQYRETDFAFVSRLLEEEGIYYFFVHREGSHELWLADDSIDSSQPCSIGCDALIYNTIPDNCDEPSNVVLEWEHSFLFRSGVFAHTDFDFKRPDESLLTTARTAVDLPGMDEFEIYDYPGGYDNIDTGMILAEIRVQEEDSRYEHINATSCHLRLAAGHNFDLTNHPSDDGVYLVTSIQHSAKEPGALIPNPSNAEAYSNRFTAVPAAVPFRPPRITPKPVIPGVQTAIVVGPRGKDIHTDKYGRIKVQFHWDRREGKDKNPSCWIRVSQQQPKRRMTRSMIPEVDDEVIVSFIEGDPDRPIVLGRVYNGEDRPRHQWTDYNIHDPGNRHRP